VLRWKKRINAVSTIVKEISVGTAENLAKMLEDNLDNIILKSLSAGSTLASLYLNKALGFRHIVNSVMSHKGIGMSPGEYLLLFIMNRLSDLCSKNGIGKSMRRDYASIILS